MRNNPKQPDAARPASTPAASTNFQRVFKGFPVSSQRNQEQTEIPPRMRPTSQIHARHKPGAPDMRTYSLRISFVFSSYSPVVPSAAPQRLHRAPGFYRQRGFVRYSNRIAISQGSDRFRWPGSGCGFRRLRRHGSGWPPGGGRFLDRSPSKCLGPNSGSNSSASTGGGIGHCGSGDRSLAGPA